MIIIPHNLREIQPFTSYVGVYIGNRICTRLHCVLLFLSEVLVEDTVEEYRGTEYRGRVPCNRNRDTVEEVLVEETDEEDDVEEGGDEADEAEKSKC